MTKSGKIASGEGMLEILERAIETQLDTFFVFDPATGKAIRWNKAFRVLSGYSDDEIASMPAPQSYYSKEDLERAAPFIEKVIQSGEGKIELSLICKDGRSIPFEYAVGVIKDDQNNPLYFISVGREISERQKIEKQLKDQEERFRLLYERSPLGYQSLDKDGYFIEANPALQNLLGYTGDEIIGKWFGDVLAPEFADQFKTNFPKFKAAGEIVGIHFDMITKNGQRVSVSIDGKIGYDTDGKFKQTHCVIHDITEQKQAEQTLRNSEERYKGIVENTANCIAVYEAIDDGEDFVLLDFNPSAEKTERITRDQVIGKRVTEVFPGVSDFGLLDVFRKVYTSGKPVHHPISIYRDKRIQGYRENYIYKLSSGEIVALYQDLTEKKMVEDELLQHRVNLEKLVKERTLEVEEKNKELERNMRVFVGRELTIRNLQNRVNELEMKLKRTN